MSTDQYARFARSRPSGNVWKGSASDGVSRTLTTLALGAQTRKLAPDLSGKRLAPSAVVPLTADTIWYTTACFSLASTSVESYRADMGCPPRMLTCGGAQLTVPGG